MRPIDIVRAVVWLAPAGPAKSRLLSRLGHQVAPDARAQPNLVWRVDQLVMGPGSRIGRGNLVKHLRRVELGEQASIGRMNVLSSHPVYQRLLPEGAAIRLGTGAKVTSRHHLDCSGGITVDDFASLAGHHTLVLTHSVDLGRDAQAAHPVTVGRYGFVGARCILLGGARLPERSVLGAGGVLPRSAEDRRPGLWAGSPATWRREVSGAWFERRQPHTRRVALPSGEIVENAF